MPDISMCLDSDCPSRLRCVRHEASGTRPNEHRQTYGGFSSAGMTRCAEYAPVRDAEHRRLIPQEPRHDR